MLLNFQLQALRFFVRSKTNALFAFFTTHPLFITRGTDAVHSFLLWFR
jgi:hypothetical protein